MGLFADEGVAVRRGVAFTGWGRGPRMGSSHSAHPEDLEVYDASFRPCDLVTSWVSSWPGNIGSLIGRCWSAGCSTPMGSVAAAGARACRAAP